MDYADHVPRSIGTILDVSGHPSVNSAIVAGAKQILTRPRHSTKTLRTHTGHRGTERLRKKQCAFELKDSCRLNKRLIVKAENSWRYNARTPKLDPELACDKILTNLFGERKSKS